MQLQVSSLSFIIGTYWLHKSIATILLCHRIRKKVHGVYLFIIRLTDNLAGDRTVRKETGETFAQKWDSIGCKKKVIM